MAGPCWTPVVLVFLLSAQHSFGAVDQGWLTNIVAGLKNEYDLDDAFTLAVNIPKNQDPANLKDILQNDPVDKVKEAISQGQVYQGTRVIAATQANGLSQVLENIQSLMSNSQGNVLVIYSEVAPNSTDNSIADKINLVIQHWSAYAFVFSRVTDTPTADPSERVGSFKLLDISKLGLENIFRCDKPNDSFQCTSCSTEGDVTPSCVANSAPSNQEQVTGADISAGAGSGADAGANTGAEGGADESAGTDANSGGDTDAGAGTSADGGAGVGVGTGAIVDAGSNAGTDVGTYTNNEKTTGTKKRVKTDKIRKCKGRKQGCKRKKGSKRRKAGKVRRQRKRGSRRSGRLRKPSRGGRRRGGRKSRKSGRRRGGRKSRKSTRRRGGKGSGKRDKRRRGGKRRKKGKFSVKLFQW